VPFIYYGEEIGLLGKKPDEDIRLPMQWSAEANAGFSAAASAWRPAHPDYATKNVAAQSADPASLLAFYRALIHLRNTHAALRVGETFVLETGSLAVYALLRASTQETALVVVNLGAEAVSEYALTLAKGPLTAAGRLVPLLGDAEAAPLTVGPQGEVAAYRPLAELPPHSVFIWQVQPER
jgi:glycosidase